ncbi:hypothetical protein Tco_0232585 [Tanacetum coccineum]
MTSFDYRLNPIYAIKECSTCGVLYTADFCCSKKGLEDKILVPKPPRNCARCARCGTPVDGPYCQGCALLRKKFKEDLFTYCVENEFFKDLQDTSESSDDNTNVVNAPQEPFVVKQDPGSSQSPPQINHNCCHECGDSLDEIFCRRCTCKSCGKGAHIGYNCPTQIPIITNPEPCYNQDLNEILQNLQSLQQQCLFGTCQQCGCNEYDGVCFYCKVGNETQINVSTPYSSNDSPSVANHPPQPQYAPYSRELCGNDSHYGYDCQPQVPFLYKRRKKKSESRKNKRLEIDLGRFPFVLDDDVGTTPLHSHSFTNGNLINSLVWGTSILDTIPETESDEVIKSSVEKTPHTLSQSKNLEFSKFKIEPDPGDLTSIDLGIRKNASTTNVNVPLEDDQSSLFAYVVWIFLAFLTYPVVPPYLLSTRNEDTIFDPGISMYHSFMPDVSHRSGTFMKFNDFPDCEDSQVSTRVSHPQLHFGNPERITKKRTKNKAQNDKTGLGMEKTVKDKAKSKPKSQSSQKVNRKVNWSRSKSTQVNPDKSKSHQIKKYKFKG